MLLQGNLLHRLETCRWKRPKPAPKRNVPFSKMWKLSSIVPPMPRLAAAPPSAPMGQGTKSITALLRIVPGSFWSRGQKDAWLSIDWWHWWPGTASFWCLRGCQVSQDFFPASKLLYCVFCSHCLIRTQLGSHISVFYTFPRHLQAFAPLALVLHQVCLKQVNSSEVIGGVKESMCLWTHELLCCRKFG